ncbi:SDR family oxidoreductase [Candidatus Sumerlaeota bacterium]|nr:SDR family oxidoreductase [Candidatus Sumerlaeota bacterium]
MDARKVALVTGSNRGIGLEICRQLSAGGFQVILTSRDEKSGKEACKELEKDGLEVHYEKLDVTSPDDVRRTRDAVEQKFERLDVLVNNAGIMLDQRGGGSTVLETTDETVRKTLEINTIGPLALSRAFIPTMKKNGYGRIVNMSSGLGQLSEMGGGYVAYRLSKAALNALTCILSDELKDTNVIVNAMCPGWVRTRMGGPDATRSVKEGADTALYLSTLPDDGPRGGLFRDREPIAW